ncbi:tyrosine-type recombinase/integrase [Bacillus sp. FSL K6-3431]|uniref:tyrosine-type recombinase/integrase n=1 Tax=Bacillus sp. FSL K6-3431 TaxID=2921500 RepID=UPI0030F4D46B
MSHQQPNYFRDYIDTLISKGIKESTRKQYSSDLHKFLVWMKDYKGSSELETLKTFNDRDVEAYVTYLSDKSYSDATFRRLLSVLNSFLKYFNIYSTVLMDKPKELPLRSLHESDFISDNEMGRLLDSMSKPSKSEARNHLIKRNLSIVCLARYYGLTPKDTSSIRMNAVNLFQNTIQINSNGSPLIITLHNEHLQYIREYWNSIDMEIRPRYWSNDPLFVAFYNLTFRFRFNYDTGIPQPLSIRGIQEMIKDEVKLAKLRKISAKHLRNSCILDRLSNAESINSVLSYFRLSDPFSIRRYQEYLSNKG